MLSAWDAKPSTFKVLVALNEAEREIQMLDIHIYVQEIRGTNQIIGMVPGKELFDLGSRSDAEQALICALDVARLLNVPENNIHLYGKTVKEWLQAGLKTRIGNMEQRTREESTC
ncbi:hypothetical protein [Paenibacillus sp. S150]|uniref:hypothetical protein n=1 Tax=Paenibacillus sp. S150 TaxID=2749826 RepID=UPI001C59D66F|nr:hypothetical protein [Paenibacillus sp. S150]MBW4081295.1 hypothetical protein [Paenibacillus sp. S150]